VTSQPTQQATAESAEKVPVGTINVVDPHPLNWLYITWNTMEEPVRTDERGHMVELAETEVTEEHWSRKNGS
jgi:hypothetical protein